MSSLLNRATRVDTIAAIATKFWSNTAQQDRTRMLARQQMSEREAYRMHKVAEYECAKEEWVKSWDTPQEATCLATWDRLYHDLEDLDEMDREAA